MIMNMSACQLFANREERSPEPQAMRGKELFLFQSFGAGAMLQRCLVT